MSEDGIPINDPKSGAQIGLIPVEKARVKVQSVYQSICIAGTYRTYTVGGNSLGNLFGPEKEVKEEMDAEISEEHDVDKTVRVGDTATLIILEK